MGWQIIRQPDGLLGVFSSNTDNWVATDCTPDEAEELFAEDMGRDMAQRLRGVREKIRLVLGGEAGKAYYQFVMTYEHASELAAGNGPGSDEADL